LQAAAAVAAAKRRERACAFSKQALVPPGSAAPFPDMLVRGFGLTLLKAKGFVDVCASQPTKDRK
jgi:hypothetical protein